MSNTVFVTTNSLLTEYRADYDAVMLRLKPNVALAKTQSELTGEPVHEVLTIEYNNKQYECSVYHSSFDAHCMVYMLMPRKNYFEAIGYDKETHRYYLYQDHFFQQYRERLSIKDKSHVDILKHYLEHNPLMLFSRYITKKGDTQSVMAVVRSGVLHGYITLPYRSIVNFRTLITHRTLTKKQSEYTSRLRRVLMSMENYS